jgi:hypothetical protein
VRLREPNPWFAPPAWWSTTLDETPAPSRTWVIRRWPRAVTREAARAHLGLEPQRPWPERAMARTTPAWWSLASLRTLTAHPLLRQASTRVRVTA